VPHEAFDIRGRAALVTGSSRGLGRALADGLIAAGCRVVLHGRDPEALERAAADTGAAAHVAFDVTDGRAVAAGVAAAQAAVGPLDVLVNNAGLQHRAPLEAFPEEAWRRLLDVNLTSAFLVGREVARGMLERGRGKIVNICSLMSSLARPTTVPYQVSKGGIAMLTRGLAIELAPHDIQVNAIAPGYFRSELTAPLVADPEFSAWLERRTPAGRWGELHELAGAAVFLAAPASRFVTGQILYVDGGVTAAM
jgi:gluconate 5-dehydrogenase